MGSAHTLVRRFLGKCNLSERDEKSKEELRPRFIHNEVTPDRILRAIGLPQNFGFLIVLRGEARGREEKVAESVCQRIFGASTVPCTLDLPVDILHDVFVGVLLSYEWHNSSFRTATHRSRNM